MGTLQGQYHWPCAVCFWIGLILLVGCIGLIVAALFRMVPPFWLVPGLGFLPIPVLFMSAGVLRSIADAERERRLRGRYTIRLDGR